MKDISPVICSVIASDLKGISNSSQNYIQTRINSWYEIALEK